MGETSPILKYWGRGDMKKGKRKGGKFCLKRKHEESKGKRKGKE
jgi:hypothetical protein